MNSNLIKKIVSVKKIDFEIKPIFFDLKTGEYGKNLGFGVTKKQDKILSNYLEKSISDYINHTKESPLVEIFKVEI